MPYDTTERDQARRKAESMEREYAEKQQEKEVQYEVVDDNRLREAEAKIESLKAMAEDYAKQFKEVSQQVNSLVCAGLNHGANNGQIVLCLNGRFHYLTGKEAQTLHSSLGGLLDGLPDRFFTDYGMASASKA